MRYALVAVDSPVPGGGGFSYAIPPGMDLGPGHPVWVPFGARTLQGIVLELLPAPGVAEVREIAGLVHPQPLLSPLQLGLARWLSEYYLSPLYHALSLFLPPGWERPAQSFFQRAGEGEGETPEESQVLAMTGQGGVSLEEVEEALGQRRAARVLRGLVRRGLLRQEWRVAKSRVTPRRVRWLKLAVPAPEALRIAEEPGAPRRAALLRVLAERGELPLAEARRLAGEADRVLLGRGLAVLEERVVRRDPLAGLALPPLAGPARPTPTPEQARALAAITAALDRVQPGEAPVFLLQGVTGSGKTEVYLSALKAAAARGRRGAVLVPEIALTPQTVARFSARFPGRVALLHSGLSLGERYDTWWAIRRGEYDVVIGPRSALFSPQPSLGLIVLDEEHDPSYKEGEHPPRYHAREVALELGRRAGAVVVLGSATPSLESFYRAERGEIARLELPERVSPAAPPRVEVVDMRQELRRGNRSPLSLALQEGLRGALAAGEKAILFLNRRGEAPRVRCRRCGWVALCRRCEVGLVYHRSQDRLLCHQCGLRTAPPEHCPRCGSPGLSFLGLGTQRVEAEAKGLLGAPVVRWDRDTARGRAAPGELLGRFASEEGAILVGTQMVAQGLDLPQVTLVGVVLAEAGLHFPDFRSGERTFQLLSQVSGRAGRGALPGRVIIQTYLPEHYAIRAAAHDPAAFYRQELEYRRRFGYPPFSSLVRLVYAHPNTQRCRQEAERLRRRLEEAAASQGVGDISFIGPSPCFYHRLRGRYRWQLLLRVGEPQPLLSSLPLPPGWTADVDPIDLL